MKFKVGDKVKVLNGHYVGSKAEDKDFINRNGEIDIIKTSVGTPGFDWELEHGDIFSEDELELVESVPESASGTVRTFSTGATRDTDQNKLDYEGFLSPLVLERYAQYLNKHRVQSDGELRDSDNWQKGIPKDAYMKSAWRHFMDWWKGHRNPEPIPAIQDWNIAFEDSICAVMFNCMGYLHECLKEKPDAKTDS